MAPPPPPLAASTPLLHGEFGSYPARGPRFALTLTSQALHIQRLRPKPEARPRGGLVPLAEVSGCCTLRSRSPSDSAAYFCIYTYPRSRRGSRRRTTRTFRTDGATTYEENRAEAQRWATALTCLLRGLPLPGDGEITPDLLPRPPRLLLLVNPFGGRGLAWQWCKNYVLPMISEAGLSFNLIQTERQNHARELVQGLSLSEWDGIVTVSGDGLLHEVLNGLLDRPDWEEAVKMPVGILPCGSGNALAGAVNQHGGPREDSDSSTSSSACPLWTAARSCPRAVASMPGSCPPLPQQLALGFSRFIQDRVNGGGGRMGSLTERGGSLFLKNINVFICIITSLGHPAGRPVGHRAGREQGVSLSKAEESSARWGCGAASQGPVLGLVSRQHGAVVGQLLAHSHHFLPQQGVLLLQEGRPHRYLVLLEPPGVPGPLGCLVVLVPAAPIFLVLGEERGRTLRSRGTQVPARE
uniref:sphingosine kinase n=1 Tax=Macaca nemestrina TaxID=9545 RepID=A0A2K6DCP3_MACNE